MYLVCLSRLFSRQFKYNYAPILEDREILFDSPFLYNLPAATLTNLNQCRQFNQDQTTVGQGK